MDTLRPLNARHQVFQEEMRKRSAEVECEATEVRTAQLRQNTEPSQPPSSIVDKVPERSRKLQRCRRGCGHVFEGGQSKTNGMKAFHPKSRCLLAGDERYCAVAPQEHAKSIAYGKDPSIDFDKDDQETHHESWVKSPYGCQH